MMRIIRGDTQRRPIAVPTAASDTHPSADSDILADNIKEDVTA